MHLSTEAESILKDFEKGPKGGAALEAYLCPAGVWTIGWGHTGPDVFQGLKITHDRAVELFRKDVAEYENLVSDLCVRRPTTNQFSAMVLLAFNIGPGWVGKKKPKGARNGFRQSSVLRFHNEGNFAKAAESFLLWNQATGSDGVKRELRGLTLRRGVEMGIYLRPTVAMEAIDPIRTRAVDVEPTEVGGDDQSVTLGKITGMAAAVTALSTASGQVIAQSESVWSGLIKAAGPAAPHVLMGAFGLIAVLAICVTVYFVSKRRSRA